ncbi:MAG: HAD-IA family hydrolase [Clostridia bacterium]|nr:HAD-IA family hydrolase [Clostridia bacterium]
MKYKTYIFDLDGTLLDTLQDLANSVNFAMRNQSYPQRTIDEVRAFIGNGIAKLIERAVPDGTDEKDCAETLAIFKAHYLEHLADNTKAFDGITEVIDYLKADGCKVAVVSNKANDAAQAVVRDYFGERFDMVVGKMDCFPTKPSPESVFYVIKTLGSDFEDCIYIGDSDVDVETAHNAGLPCIGVTWGNRSKDVLEKSGADFIAEKPDEIISLTK